jgi:hypothetical protein
MTFGIDNEGSRPILYYSLLFFIPYTDDAARSASFIDIYR